MHLICTNSIQVNSVKLIKEDADIVIDVSWFHTIKTISHLDEVFLFFPCVGYSPVWGTISCLELPQ